jgi:hypothetical protein
MCQNWGATNLAHCEINTLTQRPSVPGGVQAPRQGDHRGAADAPASGAYREHDCTKAMKAFTPVESLSSRR